MKSVFNFAAGMVCLLCFLAIVFSGIALPFYMIGLPFYWHHWYCAPAAILTFTLFSSMALVIGEMSIYFFCHVERSI